MVVLLGIGGVFALRLFRKTSVQSPDLASGLELASDRLNFGEVWEDTHFPWVLPITNHGDRDIEISKFRTTCNCSKIEPSSLRIPAGETREIHLTLDFSPKRSEGAGSSVRDFEVEISPDMPIDAGESKRIWWKIRGRVRSAIQCDPPFVDFGRESELAQPLSPQRVSVKTFTSVRSLKAVCTPRKFYVKVQRHSAKESSSFDLIVTPHEALRRGAIRCTISLVPELPNGKRLPEKKVLVIGHVVGDIEASSPSVLFGAQKVGTTAEDTITLRSLTVRPFSVLNVRCEGVGMSVERVRDASPSESVFRIKQTVNAANGEQHAKVVFRVRPKGEKEEDVVVPVSYCGIKGGSD